MSGTDILSLSKGGTAADFLLRIFKTDTPSLDDIICAKQALTRTLQGGELGWLIWDQAAQWLGWTQMLEKDFRRIIKEHPPWLSPTTAERRRLAARRSNGSITIDQARVAMFQSRIRQALSKYYSAPLSNPHWEALVTETNANKGLRFKIMEKAVAGKLIPEITRPMLESLTRAPPESWLREQRERAQRLRAMRARREQEAQEAAWRRQRQLRAASLELTKAGILDQLKNRIAELEGEIERLTPSKN